MLKLYFYENFLTNQYINKIAVPSDKDKSLTDLATKIKTEINDYLLKKFNLTPIYTTKSINELVTEAITTDQLFITPNFNVYKKSIGIEEGYVYNSYTYDFIDMGRFILVKEDISLEKSIKELDNTLIEYQLNLKLDAIKTDNLDAEQNKLLIIDLLDYLIINKDFIDDPNNKVFMFKFTFHVSESTKYEMIKEICLDEKYAMIKNLF